MSKKLQLCVGIDLGTTYSSCHYYDFQRNVHVPLIFSDQSDSIASVVNFDTIPVTVGTPGQTVVCEMKRLLGMKYDLENPQIKEAIQQQDIPYEIVNGKDGYVAIKVNTAMTGKVETMSPEMISGMVLREIYENLLRRFELKDRPQIPAVISVPAYFSDEQKDATRAAAMMSGFQLLSIIHEPTCALKAYQIDSKKDGYYVSFDVGGGTFDLTVVKRSVGGKVLKPILTGGDDHLGGVDFDKNFMKYLLERIEEENEEIIHLFKFSGRDTPEIRK